MARASTPTLLSLDRFAEIMGISPPHFNGATCGNLFPYSGRCNDLWFQHQWQSADRVSREDLAREIAQAEEDIASVIGFSVAPMFIAQEVHRYPRHYRVEVRYRNGNTTDASNRPKATRTDYGKVISPGVRNTSLIGTATVAGLTLVYSDEDSDGYAETATITLPTTLTDVCEIKAFYPGETDEEYEIRPARTVAIAAGVLTMTFWTWQFILQELYEAFPTADGAEPIDSTDDANLLASVDIRRVFVDTTATSARFFWEGDVACTECGGSGCAACQLTYQDGCLHVREPELGFVVPSPATYDEDNGYWQETAYAYSAEPDMISIWYYAGALSNEYLRGKTCDPLSNKWARIVAYLAVARLERPFCSCENLAALADWLRSDLAASDKNVSRFVTRDVETSVFGTRRGEVYAWQQINKLSKKNARFAVG